MEYCDSDARVLGAELALPVPVPVLDKPAEPDPDALFVADGDVVWLWVGDPVEDTLWLPLGGIERSENTTRYATARTEHTNVLLMSS